MKKVFLTLLSLGAAQVSDVSRSMEAAQKVCEADTNEYMNNLEDEAREAFIAKSDVMFKKAMVMFEESTYTPSEIKYRLGRCKRLMEKEGATKC